MTKKLLKNFEVLKFDFCREKKWIVVKDTQIKLFRWVPGKIIEIFYIMQKSSEDFAHLYNFYRRQIYHSALFPTFVPVTATANITKIPQKSVVQDQDESTTIASSENTQDSTVLGRFIAL